MYDVCVLCSPASIHTTKPWSGNSSKCTKILIHMRKPCTYSCRLQLAPLSTAETHPKTKIRRIHLPVDADRQNTTPKPATPPDTMALSTATMFILGFLVATAIVLGSGIVTLRIMLHERME